MYLLVARYYIVRALITPLGKKMPKKMGVHAKTTKQNKTKKTMQMQVIHTHINTHIYMCVCVCVYIS